MNEFFRPTATLFSLCGAFLATVFYFPSGGDAQSKSPSTHQITRVYQDEPCYSPDGKKILFLNDDDGPANVYVMNSEGRPAIRRLTNNSVDADGPVWSPDGTLIAFSGKEHDGAMEIYVMSADGSNLRQITHDHVQDMHPSWSPDGTRILYTTTRDSTDQKNPAIWGTYSIHLDGNSQTSIFEPNGVNTYASYSSDGSKILFRRKTDGGKNSQVFVMNADGTQARNLTNLPVYDRFPLWSSDARKIVFESNRAGHSQLYLMDADGSNVRLLVDGPGTLTAPRFSPDGKKVIYSRVWEGEVKIFTVEAF